MDYLEKIIGDIECHDAVGIRDCFTHGIDPNMLFRNEPLFNELTSEYARTDNFTACVQAFVDNGLIPADKILIAVLLDDAAGLELQLKESPKSIHNRYTMRCAYTPLQDATLLHLCAEFNLVACAELLVNSGADLNATAGVDGFGFGAQTPIFHTVNQNQHHSLGMLDFLLKHGARLDITVKGLIWGKGYDWETFIPSVNPLSYAMMGLLPQMHRRDSTINSVVKQLLLAAYGIDYTPGNVPNKYLVS